MPKLISANFLRLSFLATSVLLLHCDKSLAWYPQEKDSSSDANLNTNKNGLSKTQPATGPSVKLAEDLYMVPYVQSVDESDIRFEMIPIPGGKITIGSPESQPGRSEDEGPEFTVEVEPFWMAKTELTWAEYKVPSADTAGATANNPGFVVLTTKLRPCPASSAGP
ncbi:MAG: formylglycine-generating enzyme family protein, partial [Pirellula sp.]